MWSKVRTLLCRRGRHRDMQYTMGEMVFSETATSLVTVHIMVCRDCQRIGETAGEEATVIE